MHNQRNKLLLELALIIKKYRNKTTKSISLISDEIDLSKSIWSDLEKGKKDPQFITLWRIAEGLNVPLSQIIREIEENTNNSFSFLE